LGDLISEIFPGKVAVVAAFVDAVATKERALDMVAKKKRLLNQEKDKHITASSR
jgi:hypothetical protein